MATKRQTTDSRGHDEQKQNRTRGTLESDCAVEVVPLSSATALNNHQNVGIVRQNLGFSEMDVSGEVEQDTEPMKNSLKNASTTFQLGEDPPQSNPCVSTVPSTTFSPNTVECRPSFDPTLQSVGTEELEVEVRRMRRLHMEDQLDELEDNGDTYVFNANVFSNWR